MNVDIERILKKLLPTEYDKGDNSEIMSEFRGVANKLQKIKSVLDNIKFAADFFDGNKIDSSIAYMRIDDWEVWGNATYELKFWPNAGACMHCSIKMHEKDLDKFIDQYAKYRRWTINKDQKSEPKDNKSEKA